MATTASGGPSPSSSPRLPSPPPFTEDQIGPKSPTIGDPALGYQNEPYQTSPADAGSARRTRPGSRAIDMASGPPLIPLTQLDSAFQLQEHLAALYSHYTCPPTSKTTIPLTRATAMHIANAPQSISPQIWLYELCRFLTLKANALIVAFFSLSPPCSASTCSEMRASEWQYLCAVHDPPKPCCAIDYCCHTLDWAANILTNPLLFPSRMSLSFAPPSNDAPVGGVQSSMRHLTNIFRRVYRIFAHAWFQHRSVFWQVENRDGLYILFKTVCDIYGLIPEDNYTIPQEAETFSDDSAESPTDSEPDQKPRMIILAKKKDNAEADHEAYQRSGSVVGIPEVSSLPPPPLPPPTSSLPPPPPPPKATVIAGATTRRHKATPSTGSAVATIEETNEDVPTGDETVVNVGLWEGREKDGHSRQPLETGDTHLEEEQGQEKELGGEYSLVQLSDEDQLPEEGRKGQMTDTDEGADVFAGESENIGLDSGKEQEVVATSAEEQEASEVPGGRETDQLETKSPRNAEATIVSPETTSESKDDESASSEHEVEP